MQSVPAKAAELHILFPYSAFVFVSLWRCSRHHKDKQIQARFPPPTRRRNTGELVASNLAKYTAWPLKQPR